MKTETRTVDLVGVTLSARFGHSQNVNAQPVRLSSAPLRVDTDLASSLPCVAALIAQGVEFAVFWGCPMLRASGVPRGASADALLNRVTSEEFASEAMRRAVRRTVLQLDPDTVDDLGGFAPGLSPLAEDAAAMSDNDNANAALLEWCDLPLCAMRIDDDSSSPPIEATASTSMFVPVDDSVSIDCGKRLNCVVALCLAYAGLANHCVSLFAMPESVMLFPKQYRTTVQEDWFRERKRGVYVFGVDAAVVQSALAVAKNAVAVVLSQWQFAVERAPVNALSGSDLSVGIASPALLKSVVCQRDLVALTVGVGRAVLNGAELESALKGAARLRLLVLHGCRDVAVAHIDALMRHNTELIVCWQRFDDDVRALARSFTARVCLVPHSVVDASEVRGVLLANGVDEQTARALVGTHFATMALRASARDRFKIANVD